MHDTIEILESTSSVSENKEAHNSQLVPPPSFEPGIIVLPRSEGTDLPELQISDKWTHLWLLKAAEGRVYLEKGEQSERHESNVMKIAESYVVPAGVPFRIVNHANNVRILVQHIVQAKHMKKDVVE